MMSIVKIIDENSPSRPPRQYLQRMLSDLSERKTAKLSSERLTNVIVIFVITCCSFDVIITFVVIAVIIIIIIIIIMIIILERASWTVLGRRPTGF